MPEPVPSCRLFCGCHSEASLRGNTETMRRGEKAELREYRLNGTWKEEALVNSKR
jgi:hypothetical protein